jgi:hypothetical protein
VAVGKFAVPIPPVGGARRAKRQLSGSQQAHVAAWDLPSLDYLDEEQTIKYLHRSFPIRNISICFVFWFAIYFSIGSGDIKATVAASVIK